MKSNITEKDLLRLNFEKQREDDPPADPFYYYTLEIGEFTLISNADDQAIEDGWVVDVFDYLSARIYDTDLLERFINNLHEINNYNNEKA